MYVLLQYLYTGAMYSQYICSTAYRYMDVRTVRLSHFPLYSVNSCVSLKHAITIILGGEFQGS